MSFYIPSELSYDSLSAVVSGIKSSDISYSSIVGLTTAVDDHSGMLPVHSTTFRSFEILGAVSTQASTGCEAQLASNPHSRPLTIVDLGEAFTKDVARRISAYVKTLGQQERTGLLDPDTLRSRHRAIAMAKLTGNTVEDVLVQQKQDEIDAKTNVHVKCFCHSVSALPVFSGANVHLEDPHSCKRMSVSPLRYQELPPKKGFRALTSKAFRVVQKSYSSSTGWRSA